MASIRKEDAAITMYPLNAAAQDMANNFSETKGRNVSEKISAALSAHHIQALKPRSISYRSAANDYAPASAAKSISAPSLKRSFGQSKSFVGYSAPRAVSVMPVRTYKPSFSFFGLAA